MRKSLSSRVETRTTSACEPGGPGQGHEGPGDVAAHAVASLEDVGRAAVGLDILLFLPLAGQPLFVAQVADLLRALVDPLQPEDGILGVALELLGPRGAFSGVADEALGGLLPDLALPFPEFVGARDAPVQVEHVDRHLFGFLGGHELLLLEGRDVLELEQDPVALDHRPRRLRAGGRPTSAGTDRRTASRCRGGRCIRT